MSEPAGRPEDEATTATEPTEPTGPGTTEEEPVTTTADATPDATPGDDAAAAPTEPATTPAEVDAAVAADGGTGSPEAAEAAAGHDTPAAPTEDASAAPTEGVTAPSAGPTDEAATADAAPADGVADAPAGTDAAPTADGTTEGATEGATAATPGTAPRPAPGPRPTPGRGAPRPTPASTGPGRPAPGPRGPGRPGAARPGRRRDEEQGAPAVTAEHAPEDTARWGRVDADGVVHVTTPDGERVVGSYPDVPADQALAYFGRRFADLVAQADLVEQRLAVPDAPVGELRSALAKVGRAVTDATAVGDLAALGARVEELGQRVTQREREANIAREEARTEVRARRVALVEEAEALGEADPAGVQWKSSGERLRAIFEEWREQQRAAGTARLPKGEEDELWRRLKHARNRFERHRRHHFAELDSRHGEAKAVKEGLIAEAEALSSSREWGPTSTAYRQLMDRWKAAPRAARKDDDALWTRFRAAQDVFFAARDEKDAEQDGAERENLVVKEALLVEAEALLPVKDPRAATASLRDIQDRWEAAGRVPRADLGRVEKRLRDVEQAIRDADSERWRRTNPEGRARTDSALGQLQSSITALEGELEQARAGGDQRAVRRAEEALEARRAWLEQVQRAAADFGG